MRGRRRLQLLLSAATAGGPARVAALLLSMQASVSRKSASTSAENNMRTHNAKRPGCWVWYSLATASSFSRCKVTGPNVGAGKVAGSGCVSASLNSRSVSGLASLCARPPSQLSNPAWWPAMTCCSARANSKPARPCNCSNCCAAHRAPAAECVLSWSATRSRCADSSRVARMYRWKPGRSLPRSCQRPANSASGARPGVENCRASDATARKCSSSRWGAVATAIGSAGTVNPPALFDARWRLTDYRRRAGIRRGDHAQR